MGEHVTNILWLRTKLRLVDLLLWVFCPLMNLLDRLGAWGDFIDLEIQRRRRS